MLLLFHPPEGGLVVGWRIVVVFYFCFTRLRAGSWLVGVLLLFSIIVSPARGRARDSLADYCCFSIVVSPAYSGLTSRGFNRNVFYYCFTRLQRARGSLADYCCFSIVVSPA
jgi:hypothetical protein